MTVSSLDGIMSDIVRIPFMTETPHFNFIRFSKSLIEKLLLVSAAACVGHLIGVVRSNVCQSGTQLGKTETPTSS
jgi:hypothetical protein